MAYSGLNWQVRELSFGGLNQRADDRARPQPFLDVAHDIQFDEIGGVQTRYPFAAMSNAIFGGGTLANCRRLAVVNDELCVFTDVALYSWNAQLAKWVLRSTHLAVDVQERSVCVGSGDQIDTDRAELAGTIVYAWTEGTQVYAQAIDKATGSVLVPATAVSTAVGRPRLVALLTKILLFVDAGGSLISVRVIDPAAPGTAIAGAGNTFGANFNLYYDVVQVDGADTAAGAYRRSVTTSYTVFTVTAAGTVTLSTKARNCDGPIALAVTPTAANIQIARCVNSTVEGDLLSIAFADVFTGQAIGAVPSIVTPRINQITVAYSSVLVGGQYVATVFWGGHEVDADTASDARTMRNTISTGNVLGVASPGVIITRMLGLASRAFAAGGRVYVWFVFGASSSANGFGGAGAVPTMTSLAGHFQNTYFLYRDDSQLISWATPVTAGGYSPSTGRLPGVAATSVAGLDFAWCGNVRRAIDVGGAPRGGFAARSPRDISFSFDSDLARRSARLGRTLYISGGLVCQYDGAQVAEVGFLIHPYAFYSIGNGGAGTGQLAAGTYSYKATNRWANAQGEQERSTTTTIWTIPALANDRITMRIPPLCETLKLGARIAPAIEGWRTQVDPPPDDAPYYLFTSKDPLSSGNNKYLANDPTVADIIVDDNFTDAILTTKESNPENGADLEVLPPPGARVVVATANRVFLWGVSGDPDNAWYSRQRQEGEIAGFNDVLRAPVPRDGGEPTAFAIHNETPTAFRETAIYRLAGDGFGNGGAGQGQNFVAFNVSQDVGAVNQESVAMVPMGTIFKSAKGWYLLDPGWQVRYIGGAVSDYDSETVLAVNVVETQHQVRIITSARMLVWDYLAATQESPIGQWFEWTIEGGRHAVIWNGTHVYLTSTGPMQQQSTYAAVSYGIDVETAWIKLSGLQGASHARKVQPLGELRSACLVRTRIAYNYKATGGVPDYVDDKVWTPSPGVIGGPLQFKHGPKRPKCESIKVRFTAVTDLVRATRATATLAIPVQTSGTAWAATFQAAATSPGELGNALTLRLAFVVGVGAIDVRDHFAYDPASGLWSPAMGTIGVLVTGAPTVAQLEAAIVAGTTLATLTVADATPGKIVNVAAMAALAVVTGAFAGGAFGAPTGEALKLTSLALELGFEPGVYRRLAAAQQQ